MLTYINGFKSEITTLDILGYYNITQNFTDIFDVKSARITKAVVFRGSTSPLSTTRLVFPKLYVQLILLRYLMYCPIYMV